MSRTARRFAPLLRSLAVGAGVTTGVAMMTGSLAGCADENDPLTHVKKAQDTATRAPAVNRLIQFFEDAMTRDNKDRKGPTVKPLLDKIVEPMTQLCVQGELDERTNAKLVKFVSDARDPRGEACLVKALKDYKPDSNEENVRWACRAVAAMKSKNAAGPLMEVFTKIKPSKPKASTIYRDVHEAMVSLLDPSWEGQLIATLGRPVEKEGPAAVDETNLQTTAAQVLGLMKSEKAVKPLIKVLLSPTKVGSQTTTVLALVKIGKPAIGPATALLKGEDKELRDYSKGEVLKAAAGGNEAVKKAAEKASDSAYVGAAALILATIGRQETAAPLMEALGKAEDVSRAIIARELTKLPKSNDTIEAFKEAYQKTPPSLSIPPGQGGREALLEASTKFFDSSLVPWYVSTAQVKKGEEADLAPIREASLLASMKLMTKDQVSTVEELAGMKSTGGDGKASTVGKGYQKEMTQAKKLLDDCGDKVDCYLGKLTDPTSHQKDTAFIGVKAAYMVGSLGKAETRQKVIDAMPKITNDEVRFVALSVVDALSPKGDTALAAKLQKMVDDAEASRDSDRIRAMSPFKHVIYRLNARAQ
jgi:hypothetical protein